MESVIAIVKSISSLEERESYLNSLAFLDENGNVMANEKTFEREISPQEMAQKRGVLIDLDFEIEHELDELKKITRTFKERITALKNKRKTSMNQIAQKVELVTEKVWYLDDQENQSMNVVDIHGNTLEIRPLKPNERQTQIRKLNKTA